MKYLKCSLVAVAMLAMITATAQDSVANPLVDPGFESAFVDDGSGVGKWQPFAGGADNISEQGLTMPRTGAGHANLDLMSDGGFAGFFQDVPAIAGAAIDWSVWAKDNLGNGGGSIEMRIEYRDSVGDTEVSRTPNLVPALASTDYELVTLSDTIPAGADTARVVFAIQSFGVSAPQSVFVDDALVVTIPEPTSIALMGLGGLAIVATRRRK